MSSKIKTILYASDLINYDAKKVFGTAVEQSIAHGAKITFLNVIEPVDENTKLYLSNYLTLEELDKIGSDNEGNVHADIEQRIRSFCETEVSDETKLDIEDIDIKVVYGRPDEMIVKVADEIGADLIVMGTHTRNRLSNLVHHSVAHYVMVHANCPVLVDHIK
ncbi:universal stress protein [Marinobacterium sp. YM272]|uniref:universal stress protein n=1 Tax=Marinobacterium sp. YM272 TaxID=3421654 RepID=UPI003D7F9773